MTIRICPQCNGVGTCPVSIQKRCPTCAKKSNAYCSACQGTQSVIITEQRKCGQCLGTGKLNC